MPEGQDSENIQFLGLAGEAGALFSEYKKRRRDGASHAEYGNLVSEELGYLFWYLPKLVTEHGLSPSEIVEANLLRVNDRWNPDCGSFPALFGDSIDESEQIAIVEGFRFVALLLENGVGTVECHFTNEESRFSVPDLVGIRR